MPIILPKGYTVIDKNLIRGQHPSVRNLYRLKKLGVNQVYDFRHYSNFGFKFVERFFCKLLGIKYTRLAYSNLYGQYPTLDTFEKVASDVANNGKNGGVTLFHCHSGRHRTSHFSAFYALTKGKPLVQIKKDKNEYNKLLTQILKEQIEDKNYFNRHIIGYKGWNPIKLFIARLNNRIFEGLQTAHQNFLEMVKSVEETRI